jgi:hypothetical protein
MILMRDWLDAHRSTFEFLLGDMMRGRQERGQETFPNWDEYLESYDRPTYGRLDSYMLISIANVKCRNITVMAPGHDGGWHEVYWMQPHDAELRRRADQVPPIVVGVGADPADALVELIPVPELEETEEEAGADDDDADSSGDDETDGDADDSVDDTSGDDSNDDQQERLAIIANLPTPARGRLPATRTVQQWVSW